MIHLQIDSRYKPHRFDPHLRRAITAALQQQDCQPKEVDLTLVLTSDARLRALNRQFRGVDAATDVLSFGDCSPDAESGRRYLGDVVISVPRARAQARAARHSLVAELQLLAVHGTLHLLGHDHAKPAQRKAMWAAQDAILRQLGLGMASAEMEARP